MAGSLYLVSTPIGNPDDITLRALQMLARAAVIAAEDPQRTRALLARHGIATPITSYHNDNKEMKIPVLLERMQEGQSVALVSDAGTPAVVDPGALLIREALRRNIPVIAVPGPSAILAALAASGLPADAFVFVGPLARRPIARRAQLRALRFEPRTIVCFESPSRLRDTLRMLLAELGDRSIAVACNLTTPDERWLRGTITDIARDPTVRAARGELTLVIAGAPRARRPNRSRKRQKQTRSGRRAS